ncbi:hypothetical protein [Pseudomonas sp. UBA4617]|uniref:hypothetical protein n=1 Tax=Pseudomonas sp. UBA4617 TaxID=1947318 RepID=UPI0025F18270|nr:hypothetical protein [Pseudomonas sp. UBA4617]
MEFNPFDARVQGTPTRVTRVAMLIWLIKTPLLKGCMHELLRGYFALRARKLDARHPAHGRDRLQHSTILAAFLHPTIFVVKTKVTDRAFSVADAGCSERVTTVNLNCREAGLANTSIGKRRQKFLSMQIIHAF